MKLKTFKFIIFIAILFFTPTVFASTYNVSNKIEAFTGYNKGSYTGYTPTGLVNIFNYYNINTRYSGTLSRIDFYLDSDDWDWNYNSTYTITLNMATEDWRNNFMGPQVFRAESNGDLPSTNNPNLYVSNSFRFVSKKQIKFNFKINSSMSPYLYFRLYSNNTSQNAFTGVSNWNLSSITINSTSNPPAPTPVPSTPTPTPQPNNQDIINNNTDNTNNIINNNNQNTQDIIDNNTNNTSDIINNNNQNTQDIIDSQNKNSQETNSLLGVCYKNIFSIENYIFSSSRYTKTDYVNEYAIALTSNGNYTGGTFPLIYHLKLKANTTYYFKKGNSEAETGKLAYYVYRGSPNGTLVTYTDNNTDFQFTTPITNYEDYYLQIYVTGTQTSGGRIVLQRPMLFEANNYPDSSYLPYNESKCVSKLDSVNDSLTNSNVDSGVGSGFFSDFQDNQHGLTGIIIAPLTAIERLTSSTCQPLVLPIPFTNGSVSLPCMTQVYETNIPTIYNIWKVVSFGIIAYFICLDIFHIVKGFKDPESDKVEVLDL